MRVVMGGDREGRVGGNRLNFGGYFKEWGVGGNTSCSKEASGDEVAR